MNGCLRLGFLGLCASIALAIGGCNRGVRESALPDGDERVCIALGARGRVCGFIAPRRILCKDHIFCAGAAREAVWFASTNALMSQLDPQEELGQLGASEYSWLRSAKTLSREEVFAVSTSERAARETHGGLFASKTLSASVEAGTSLPPGIQGLVFYRLGLADGREGTGFLVPITQMDEASGLQFTPFRYIDHFEYVANWAAFHQRSEFYRARGLRVTVARSAPDGTDVVTDGLMQLRGFSQQEVDAASVQVGDSAR